jgi:hypothetical protein
MDFSYFGARLLFPQSQAFTGRWKSDKSFGGSRRKRALSSGAILDKAIRYGR